MEKLFIPTKNRVSNCSFIKYVFENKIPAIIVLEEEDLSQYEKAFPGLEFLVLPESNKGISFVREHIKSYAYYNSYKYYWMVDDDVSAIYKRIGTKLEKINFNDLQPIEDIFKNTPNAGLFSLEYRQFAWSATKDMIKDSFCDVFVFVSVEKVRKIKYRSYAEGKEDRDFAMQVIKSNLNTYRSTLFAFSAPGNGSNIGGLKEIFYDLPGREEVCADRLVELWGNDICNKITKSDGRVDVKINWKKINQPVIQNSLF